jgi:hypothetical protein
MVIIIIIIINHHHHHYHSLAHSLTHTHSLTTHTSGPYGASLDVARYKYISFIAGGIGITPAISCYSFIADSCVEGDLSYYSHLQQVNLVWIIQSEAQASTFLPKVNIILHLLI